MQEKKSHNAIIFITRLKSALKINTDIELADYLGIKQNTISSWKTRNSLDYNLIISKCDFISMDYLFFGKEPIFINEQKYPPLNESEKCKKYPPIDKSNRKKLLPNSPPIEDIYPPINKNECLECKLKDQIIISKEETIKALQATTEAQKKQIDMLEDIISNNDINGHSGGQKRKAG